MDQVPCRGMVPEFIRRAMLMQQPDNLIRMGDQVGGELQPNDAIDARAAAFGQIQQPASQDLARNAIRGAVPKRDREQLCRMTGGS